MAHAHLELHLNPHSTVSNAYRARFNRSLCGVYNPIVSLLRDFRACPDGTVTLRIFRGSPSPMNDNEHPLEQSDQIAVLHAVRYDSSLQLGVGEDEEFAEVIEAEAELIINDLSLALETFRDGGDVNVWISLEGWEIFDFQIVGDEVEGYPAAH
jgi:hypothetical protein